MENLSEQRCEVCQVGAPQVSSVELKAWLKEIPGWLVVESDGVKKLERNYRFKNFAEALAFVNQVGALAEQENHHPNLSFTWGEVTVQWWTHKISGLHRNDFIMAARTDQI